MSRRAGLQAARLTFTAKDAAMPRYTRPALLLALLTCGLAAAAAAPRAQSWTTVGVEGGVQITLPMFDQREQLIIRKQPAKRSIYTYRIQNYQTSSAEFSLKPGEFFLEIWRNDSVYDPAAFQNRCADKARPLPNAKAGLYCKARPDENGESSITHLAIVRSGPLAVNLQWDASGLNPADVEKMAQSITDKGAQ
ncbi:hypothetical protein [Leeia aquatica]|uniref:Uncharacterized protein n=1 Tax=Leeia aquatica TaxID=2725557 RepID=A0A847RSV6_9NEIS|nr:hypothetical protein [Leeia aquatica]NLR74290.1 hypothetical protein [Leeia aquatica]